MKFIALLTLVLSMASPGLGSAQDHLDGHDIKFLEQAAQTGMLDIQAGQLALQSTSDQKVKQYAQLILIEHEKIAGDLQGLASTHDVKLPTELDAKSVDTLINLQREQGTEFDQRYIDEVAIGAHENAVTLFTKISKETQNQAIKTFAVDSLPVLQQHLDQGRSIAK